MAECRIAELEIESDCPVPGCSWLYTPPPLPRPLPKNVTLEQLTAALVGTDKDIGEALLTHLVSHGQVGVETIVALARAHGVWDDPDMFVASTVKGEALFAKVSASLRDEVEQWLQSALRE